MVNLFIVVVYLCLWTSSIRLAFLGHQQVERLCVVWTRVGPSCSPTLLGITFATARLPLIWESFSGEFPLVLSLCLLSHKQSCVRFCYFINLSSIKPASRASFITSSSYATIWSQQASWTNYTCFIESFDVTTIEKAEDDDGVESYWQVQPKCGKWLFN